MVIVDFIMKLIGRPPLLENGYPEIEKRVREKLYVDLISLITCMYENNNKDKPIIIFSPSHSETILEYVK